MNVRYFTIQSNLIVLWVAAGLAVNPRRDGPARRVVRLDSLLAAALLALGLRALDDWLAPTDAAAGIDCAADRRRPDERPG